MKIIGLTGGIGSGKTTIAQFFNELGAPVYIADVEAKKLMQTHPEIRKEIVELLGKEAYEGAFPNRPWIAVQVFSNPVLLQQLNKIVHPRVKEDFANWVQKQNTAYVIYETAILFENGGEKQFDATILVTAPKNLRIERLQKRDASTIKQIENRMNAQWEDDQKVKLATYCIENKILTEAKAAVLQLHKHFITA